MNDYNTKPPSYQRTHEDAVRMMEFSGLVINKEDLSSSSVSSSSVSSSSPSSPPPILMATTTTTKKVGSKQLSSSSQLGRCGCGNLNNNDDFCDANNVRDDDEEEEGEGGSKNGITGTGSGTGTGAGVLRRILCRPCDSFYGGNNDAIGFALDSVPRGVTVVGGLFLMTSLLRLAKQDAGCPMFENEPNEPQQCTFKVYGMRPTSLLTSVQVIASVLVALLLPLIGAVIDHTKYRKLVGQISAFILIVLSIPPIFISETTWFTILMLQVFVVFNYAIHSTCSFAYFPELTNDESTLVKYSSSYTAVIFSSMAIVLIMIVTLTTLLGITENDIATTKISQSIVLVLLSLFLGIAWTVFFTDRPAYSTVVEGNTLLTSGFKQILSTSKKIHNYYPAIQWFLVGVAFSNAAVATLATIAVTYMTDLLEFTPTQNGIALLVLLLSTIPGSMLAANVTTGKLISPLRSLQICLLLWSFVTILAALVLRRPGQEGIAYIFAIGWGIAAGWFDPTERAVYVAIIPQNQDAELMGMYLCACQILGWLPPLVFTAMNEAGVSMRIGLASLSVYFLLTFLIIFLMGNYEDAVKCCKERTKNAAAACEG